MFVCRVGRLLIFAFFLTSCFFYIMREFKDLYTLPPPPKTPPKPPPILKVLRLTARSCHSKSVFPSLPPSSGTFCLATRPPSSVLVNTSLAMIGSSGISLFLFLFMQSSTPPSSFSEAFSFHSGVYRSAPPHPRSPSNFFQFSPCDPLSPPPFPLLGTSTGSCVSH